jgi:iron complex transport system ATP-binding protein
VGHVSARGLAVEAGGRTLFSGFDLDVAPGELVAVVGPNGVGKTTLLRVLAGVAAARTGTVFIDAKPVRELTSSQRARALTLLESDGANADGMTVREAVTIGRYAHHAWWDWRRDGDDDEAVSDALERVGLSAFSDRPATSLSSGERSRLWLALALAQGATTLLLDEPTSHLDARFAQEVLGLLTAIAQRGSSVVAVLHDLNEAAAFATRVVVIAPGRVVASDVPRVALDPEVVSSAYGVGFDALESGSGYRVLAIKRPS